MKTRDCLYLERPENISSWSLNIFWDNPQSRPKMNTSWTRKKCLWMKNQQLYLCCTISEIVADSGNERSDSWERESNGLGSRERCYQCDEGTRRSLRIIESYDCLFCASAIRDCSSHWTRHSFVLRISWSLLLRISFCESSRWY